jgi:hypothetical protein
MPVLMQSVRGYAGTMVEGLARKDRSFVATENANHRTDHAVVGALTARVWRLAPAVVAAIRLHHSLESLGASAPSPRCTRWWPPAWWPTTARQRHEGLSRPTSTGCCHTATPRSTGCRPATTTCCTGKSRSAAAGRRLNAALTGTIGA